MSGFQGKTFGKLNYGRTLNDVRDEDHQRAARAKEHAVRYSKEQKQATRQRIIEAAGHRFKTDGVDGSGIATLMADAGLTRTNRPH
ncbi:hypothetical protein [Agromyces sp. Soil535]|uniref:hypothetical protein n=1 Tax=Agromyces sp. Soil535 TaxID=1736390 RepID=UPI000A9EE1F7|nr:hypothetical protein [Agromyces sp. Soil535]